MITFIINPKAGNKSIKKSRELIKQINNIAELKKLKKDLDYQIIETKKKGDPSHAAKKALEQGSKTIVAVGGDGTLNEIAAELVCSKANLGVVPFGTGNDFVKSLGKTKTISQAIKTSFNGEEKQIDCGYVNKKFFINVAGIGFDAQVVANKNKFSWLKVGGFFSYFISIIYTLFSLETNEVTIKSEQKVFTKKILFLCAGNGKYIGGGMKITPNASIQDGLLDICVVEKIFPLRIPFLVPALMKGNHIKIKQCSYFKTNNITINSKKNIIAQLDGEVIISKQFDITIKQGAIKLLT